jgi:hypothetical protein
MFTWEDISYIIKCFISNTNLVILVLVNSSVLPYCLLLKHQNPLTALNVWFVGILLLMSGKFSVIFKVAEGQGKKQTFEW